ncbi:MAG: calcium-translocating P-type ATPase, PMCA-type [Actinobacteria bacterium]|nr:calcium-translocating P-type ATPase, PMCA-type [Actinomycetota bacterium]
MQEEIKWHSLKIDEVEKALGSDRKTGLTSAEASSRLETYGKNEIGEKEKGVVLKMILSQFNDVMVWILAAATVVSGFVLKEVIDAIVIFVILIINVVLGFIQEFRAEKALQSLKAMSTPTSVIIRDEKEIEIPSNMIVPGDILYLEPGNRISADGRLFKTINLMTDESSLTGESFPVDKIAESIREDAPITDRFNTVFGGTMVVSGKGYAMVTATGNSSEIGRIAKLISRERESTPLQFELKRVGKMIAAVCLGIAALVFLAGWLKGYDLAFMFLAGVSMAVAAIPEGLPAVVTASLAIGVQRMARKNAIVRRLSAVETLGCSTIICTDKTGTLTKNKMMVERLCIGQRCENISGHRLKSDVITDKQFKIMTFAMVLCNDARYSGDGNAIGDPTEVALLDFARSFDLHKSKFESQMPRVAEISFDSMRKMMTTVHENPEGGYIVFSKGAPESIINHSKYYDSGGMTVVFDRKLKDEVLSVNDEMAIDALRTLAFAYKKIDSIPDKVSSSTVESDLIFLGMVGMIDPPREEVYDALSACQSASIGVKMITGDHKLTAEAIGRMLGMLEEDSKVVTSEDLSRISDEELMKFVEDTRVFARVSPEDKLRIVEALQKNGHVVAMTGDGINDAPSLKKADIGIAMGIVGTDVSKEASDMVLADDNFATIVKAIREGRIIYDNLKKFIFFLLSCNISEVLTMFISIIFGSYIYYLLTGEASALFLPLLPVQILWMNLVTDGLPALALGVDPPEEGIMKRPPRAKNEGMLNLKRLLTVFWQGFVLSAGAVAVYFTGTVLFRSAGIDIARVTETMVFTTLVFVQLFHSFNAKNGENKAFSLNSFNNLFLLGSVLLSIGLQMAIIYIPALQLIFKTVPLNLNMWLLVLIGAITPVILIDLIKRIKLVIKKR